MLCSYVVYIFWDSDPTGPDFSHLASHCAHITPIPSRSYIERQDALARTLASLNAAAYIAEPGASAEYFANISSSHWHLSERPLLLVVQPTTDEHGETRANVSVLTPYFEETRARLLPIPSDAGVTYTAWPEDHNPYERALSLLPGLAGATIYVDGNVRTFVTDGLQKAAPKASVSSAPVEVRRLRERKSTEEIDILKCANEVGTRIYGCSFDLLNVRSVGNSACHTSGAGTYEDRHAGVRGWSTCHFSSHRCWSEGRICAHPVWRLARLFPSRYACILIFHRKRCLAPWDRNQPCSRQARLRPRRLWGFAPWV